TAYLLSVCTNTSRIFPASLPYASASPAAAAVVAVAVTVAFPCCGLSHLHLPKARIGLRNLQYLQDTSPSQVRPAVQPTSSLASASELKLLFNPLPGPSTQMPKAQVKTKTPTAHACPYIDTFFAQRSRHLEINDCNLAGGPPAVAAAPTTAPSPSWKYSSSSLPHGTDLLKPAGYNRRDPTTHVPHTDTLLRLYIQIQCSLSSVPRADTLPYQRTTLNSCCSPHLSRLETAIPVALAVAARCLRRRYRSSTLVLFFSACRAPSLESKPPRLRLASYSTQLDLTQLIDF
ncbi:hypothetical protein CTAM01_06585, partial [Colletotrichum tamarilloi]